MVIFNSYVKLPEGNGDTMRNVNPGAHNDLTSDALCKGTIPNVSRLRDFTHIF